jgi:hypothetical protein
MQKRAQVHLLGGLHSFLRSEYHESGGEGISIPGGGGQGVDYYEVVGLTKWNGQSDWGRSFGRNQETVRTLCPG